MPLDQFIMFIMENIREMENKMTRIGNRKTGTYYWTYKMFLKQKGSFVRAGKTRYSKNFKNIEQANKFKGLLIRKNKWYAGQLWFSESIISDKLVE